MAMGAWLCRAWQLVRKAHGMTVRHRGPTHTPDPLPKLIKFPVPALLLISDIQGMPKSGHLPAKNICAFNPKAKEFPCQLRNPEDPDCALLRNGDPSPNKLNYIKAPFLNRA